MKLVLFDGICSFCNSSIRYIIKFDKNNQLKFASQQSEIGKQILTEWGLNHDLQDTIIFIANGQIYFKSDAVLKICSYLNGYPRLIIFFGWIPKPIRDRCYDIIARNRYRFKGKSKICEIPSLEIRNKFLN